jgi:glycosyltransferase involved in cell wall biosynthesis
MSKPLLSVVIPSYNHEEYIAQALDSVIIQKYRPLELIIIDDGSQDRSCEIIRQSLPKVKDAGIEVRFIARENQGAHVTLNEGLRLAKGEWLTILNSDDYYLPNRFMTLIQEAERRKSEFVFSDVIHVDEKNRKAPDEHPFRSWYISSLKRKYPTVGFQLLDDNVAVTSGNFIFTKKLFQAIGPFRDYVLIHDYDFILRALVRTEPLWVHQELLAYRVHSSNTISGQSHRQTQEGPRVASDFILQTVLESNPQNETAPWAQKFRKEFENFWTEPPRGSLRHWLGGENLFSLYGLDESKPKRRKV